MKKALCNFIAVLNQTIKKKKSRFDFIYFSQAPTLLRALVNAGYVQYYTRIGNLLTIHLRISNEGPILLGIKQNSKPSKKVFVRWKQLKKRNTLTLILVDKQIITISDAIAIKKGGISISDII